MKRFEIAPALEPEEWRHRRCGAVSLDRVDAETHVVVRDPDGEIVSVSGPAEVFALMALANAALPDGDPRKITRELTQQLRAEPAAVALKVASLLEKLLPPERVIR
jgi:hypothetical protein